MSIPANIAEVWGRRSDPDRRHFYVVSRGSLEELRYCLLPARDLGYTKGSDALLESLDRVGAMLYRMIERLTPR